MNRYIDADATLETLKEILIKTAINNVGYKRDVDEVCKDIADKRLSVWLEYVPTADVREVVHGEWIDNGKECWDGSIYYFRQCDICGFERDDCNADYDTPYCPNCGAKLDAERREDAEIH